MTSTVLPPHLHLPCPPMRNRDDFETYYSILGVAPTASTEEISKAYRRASLTVHPDKGGDPAAFRRLSTAHDVLKDPVLRKRYDRYGTALEPSPGHLIGHGAIGRLAPLSISVLGAAAFQFSWTVGACTAPVWGVGCCLAAGGSWLQTQLSSSRADSSVPAILGGLLLGNAAGLLTGYSTRGFVHFFVVRRR